MNLFLILADAVLATHVLWILWVIAGWTLTRSRPWLRWLHIASLVWGIVVEIGPWPCPVTLLEQWLETRAGYAAYQGSFIVHYLEGFIYPDVPRFLLTWFGPLACLAILTIDALQFRRR